MQGIELKILCIHNFLENMIILVYLLKNVSESIILMRNFLFRLLLWFYYFQGFGVITKSIID